MHKCELCVQLYNANVMYICTGIVGGKKKFPCSMCYGRPFKKNGMSTEIEQKLNKR